MKWFRVGVLALLALVMVFSCGCFSSGGRSSGPMLQLNDQLGRAVSVPQNPQKIVSLDPGNTEILYALGLGDKLVGVCDETDFPEEATTKTRLGSIGSIDAKAVIKLSPDLVLASNVEQSKVIPDMEDRDAGRRGDAASRA